MTSSEYAFLQLSNQVSALAEQIDRLEASFRTANLGNSSVRGGFISIYDDSGQERGRLGRQPDGTYVGGSSRNAPGPPGVPDIPIIEPGIGTLKVRVTGPEIGVWPGDFAHVNVWYRTPTGATILAGRVTSTPTEYVIAPLAYTEHEVWLTSTNMSGRESGPSVRVRATPNRVVGDDVLTDTVQARHIKAGLISADKFGANSITAGTLQAGSVTAGKLEAQIVLANATLQTGQVGEPMVQINSVSNEIRFYPSGEANKFARIFSYVPDASEETDIALEMRSIASTILVEICRFYVLPDSAEMFLARAIQPDVSVGGSYSVTPASAALRTYNNTGDLVAAYTVGSDGIIGYGGRWDQTVSSVAPTDHLVAAAAYVDNATADILWTWGATVTTFYPTGSCGPYNGSYYGVATLGWYTTTGCRSSSQFSFSRTGGIFHLVWCWRN